MTFDEKLSYAKTGSDTRPEVISLLKNLKDNLPVLKELYKQCDTDELFYRFYHESFKVYYRQKTTIKVVEMFKSLSTLPLNRTFLKIISEGTSKVWEMSHNENWDSHTRPILEAFVHAKYFLEQMIKYGKKLEKAPLLLPSGWAAVLYLYNLR